MAVKKSYFMLGLMSGTSLDGLDIAYVELKVTKQWSFRIIKAATIRYDKVWEDRLRNAHTQHGQKLMEWHAAYGTFIGQQCLAFIKKHGIRKVDAIASHGHTIFHQPEKGFTFQLGDGQAIQASTGIPVVSDFRSLDVNLGGEGAPLVPMGDRLLFSSYDVCLNLGGIANLSMEVRGKRKAFDVCFCNMALNFLMQEENKAFDNNGMLARSGVVDIELLNKMSQSYDQIRKSRKSIGREFFEASIQPMLENKRIPRADRLRTVCESTAIELALAVPKSRKKLTMMATGGGALNGFLVQLLQERLIGKVSIVLPSTEIIAFKEALVFALLGVLRMRNEINVLSSVTGARRDSSSGAMIGAFAQ